MYTPPRLSDYFSIKPIPLDLLTLGSFSDPVVQRPIGILRALHNGDTSTSPSSRRPSDTDNRTVYPFYNSPQWTFGRRNYTFRRVGCDQGPMEIGFLPECSFPLTAFVGIQLITKQRDVPLLPKGIPGAHWHGEEHEFVPWWFDFVARLLQLVAACRVH